MEVKELERKENRRKILVKGASPAFVNAIRRTAMKDVPVFAVEKVTIYENSSVMFDEFLSHRLGMLPIKADLKGYKEKDKVVLSLEKEGPGTVYSKDIKTYDPKIEVVNKKVPITKLGKGQRIRLEMEAVLGNGSEHSKWQPVIISFQNAAEIDLEKGCSMCKKCIESCSKNILEIKAKKVLLKDPYECDLCGSCREACESGALKLRVNENVFILDIESNGAVKEKEALLEAVKILKERIGGLKKSLSKL